MKFNRNVAVFLGLASVFGATAMPSYALSETLSNASQLSIEGSALILQGSVQTIAGSTELVVKSVQLAGDSAIVVLQGASDLGRVTLQLSAHAVGNASLAVGKAVAVVSASTGYLLTLAGETIAFVPNAVGQSMIYHAEHSLAGIDKAAFPKQNNGSPAYPPNVGDR